MTSYLRKVLNDGHGISNCRWGRKSGPEESRREEHRMAIWGHSRKFYVLIQKMQGREGREEGRASRF